MRNFGYSHYARTRYHRTRPNSSWSQCKDVYLDNQLETEEQINIARPELKRCVRCFSSVEEAS